MVERFEFTYPDCDPDAVSVNHGRYVRYSDHATALAAKDAELAAVNKAWADDVATVRSQYEAQLAEARKALEPFAEASRRFDEATAHFGVALTPDHRTPKAKFTHGELRAARRVREGGKVDG